MQETSQPAREGRGRRHHVMSPRGWETNCPVGSANHWERRVKRNVETETPRPTSVPLAAWAGWSARRLGEIFQTHCHVYRAHGPSIAPKRVPRHSSQENLRERLPFLPTYLTPAPPLRGAAPPLLSPSPSDQPNIRGGRHTLYPPWVAFTLLPSSCPYPTTYPTLPCCVCVS